MNTLYLVGAGLLVILALLGMLWLAVRGKAKADARADASEAEARAAERVANATNTASRDPAELADRLRRGSGL